MTEESKEPRKAGQPLGALQLRHLLVAIDGSFTSELALSAAVLVAERDRAKLTLISVSPETWRWAAGAYAPGIQPDVDRATEQALRDAVARLPDGISIRTLFRRGKPGVEIVAAAEEGDYDAVLVGARGTGRLGSFLGSVSRYVLQEAPIPVFVAHAPRKVDQGRGT